MKIARRVYLYLVAFISLQMLLAGAANLLRLAGEATLGSSDQIYRGDAYYRDELSLWGAVLVVGTLVWAIHWLLIQRGAAGTNPEARDERRAVLRKLCLYAVLFVALWMVFFASAAFLRQLFLTVLTNSGDLRAVTTGQLPNIIVYGLGWAYYWSIRQADAAVAPEEGSAATIRRWYVYLTGFATLSVGMWAGAQVARSLWRMLTASPVTTLGGADVTAIALAGSIGWLIVGLGCWAGHWLPAQRLVAQSADEQRSVLRKVYLYGLVFQTVAVTLVNLALFLYKVLQLLLGGNKNAGIAAGDSLLTAAGMPLLAATVYGLFWAYQRQMLANDGQLVAEQPHQATIRRFYHSLVALVGLGVLAGGLADLLRLLLDLGLGGRSTTALSRAGWAVQISLFATLVIVGAPIWAFQWLQLQRRAVAAEGAAERESLVRRVYLLLILFVGVTTLLGSAAVLLYQIFRNIGATFSGPALSTLSWAAGASITAAVFVAYHLRVLLDDQRHRAARPATAPEAVAGAGAAAPAGRVMLIQFGGDEAVTAALATLREQLPPESRVQDFAVDTATLAEVRALIAARAAGPQQSSPGPVGIADPATKQPIPA